MYNLICTKCPCLLFDGRKLDDVSLSKLQLTDNL